MLSFHETPEERSDREARAARKLIMQYLRGKPLDEIRPKLKSLSTAMDCQAKYESIALNPLEHIINGIDDILNELSIGGAQLHTITLTEAKEKGYINCYVLDLSENKFFYISRDGKVVRLSLSVPFPDFAKNFKKLPHYLSRLQTDDRHKEKQSLYLSADNIKHYINKYTQHSHLTSEQQDQIKHYLNSPNLYTALKKIQDKHPHVALLVDLINETKTERPWWRYFLIATTLTVIASTLFYLKDHLEIVQTLFEESLPLISGLLNNTVYLIRTTPLIGVATNGLHLSYAWYQAVVEDSISDSTKSIKLFFRTLGHILPIAGYVLSYLAAGSMTTPAMFMFIMAAGIEIIKSITYIYLTSIEQRNNPVAPASDYNSGANKVRAETMYQRDLSIFNTNLIAHITITMSVITWHVMPPSLHITLSSVIFAWCVEMTKDLKLNTIYRESANKLQEQIDSIYHGRGKHSEIKADFVRSEEGVKGFFWMTSQKKPANAKELTDENIAPEPKHLGRLCEQ